MMLWVGAVVLVIAILLYLLFMSIDLVIDTDENQYYVSIGSLGKASVEKDEEFLVRIRLRTLFTHFDFHPLKKQKPKKKKKEKVKKKGEFKWSYLRMGHRIIRSFDLKKFYLDLDTENCITNAKLYPAFALLQHIGINCNVNFEHRNTLVLHLHNRPIRIIKTFINP